MAIAKNELIDMLYDKTGLPKKACVNIVESFFEIIKSELEKGNPVMISGFGKWTVRSKSERNGRNPKTGEEIILAARKVVTFKGAPNLFKAMNP